MGVNWHKQIEKWIIKRIWIKRKIKKNKRRIGEIDWDKEIVGRRKEITGRRKEIIGRRIKINYSSVNSRGGKKKNRKGKLKSRRRKNYKRKRRCTQTFNPCLSSH